MAEDKEELVVLVELEVVGLADALVVVVTEAVEIGTGPAPFALTVTT